MKVLALNGSPRRRASATFRLLETLLAGMRDGGAETELVHLAELDLQGCLGCYTCWVRTPGECVHRDGMARALAGWREADLVVFGTPLYHFSMTGLMKTFLDRLLPESEPWLVPDPAAAGRTMHPRRHRQPASALLVSPCGFPDLDQFAPLVHTFRTVAERHHWRWMGELLRPGAEVLARPELPPPATAYLAEVRRAGEVLAAGADLPAGQLEALSRDLFPGGPAAFQERANQHWEGMLRRHRPPEATSLPLVPAATAQLQGGVR